MSFTKLKRKTAKQIEEKDKQNNVNFATIRSLIQNDSLC